MSDPQPQPAPPREHTITVLCNECGTIIEVHDPRSLILGLHIVNECAPLAGLIVPQS